MNIAESVWVSEKKDCRVNKRRRMEDALATFCRVGSLWLKAEGGLKWKLGDGSDLKAEACDWPKAQYRG